MQKYHKFNDLSELSFWWILSWSIVERTKTNNINVSGNKNESVRPKSPKNQVQFSKLMNNKVRIVTYVDAVLDR